MKKLLVVLLLAGTGWIGYQSYQAGRFSVYAGRLSPEEAQIRDLEKQIREAKKRFAQAGRAAGLSGIDTTAQADAAMREIKRLEGELEKLRKSSGGK